MQRERRGCSRRVGRALLGEQKIRRRAQQVQQALTWAVERVSVSVPKMGRGRITLFTMQTTKPFSSML